MTDVWDIAQYVEAHPDNYEQRWRLAKKLYMAWEYRLALEHLQILTNEWEPRINVARYLAATYYRLSRYDEAIKELRAAIQIWPQELGLYEQLARTLAVADKKYEAMEVWQEIAEMDPDHPFANRAVEHLREIVRQEASGQGAGNGKSRSGEAEAGEELGPNEILCPNCGQKNSIEFRRCWKCHAALFEGAVNDEAPAAVAKAEPRGMPWPLATGLVMAALLALGVYLTLRGFSQVDAAGLNTRAAHSVDELFARAFLWTRVIIGAVLVIGWPVAWRLGAILLDVDDQIYNEMLYQAGGLMALLAYCLLWLPGMWAVLAVVLPLVLSAAIIAGLMKLRPQPAIGLWLAQAGLVGVLSITAIVGRHGPGLLIELPSILDFAGREDVETTASVAFAAPHRLNARWTSTGSPWLDRHANRADIHVHLGPHTRRVFLAILENGTERFFHQIRDDQYVHLMEDIDVGATYAVTVRSEEAVDVNLRVEGALPVSVTVLEETPGPRSN